MQLDKQLQEKIIAAGQEHLLKYWDKLDEAAQRHYAEQLGGVDFAALPELVEKYVLNRPKIEIPADLAPASYYPDRPADAGQAELYRRAEAEGEALIRAGKVACLTVAGGQGTRLGFDGPKGTYPIAPLSGRSLFSYFAGGIRKAQEKYQVKILWFIMTSLLNHEATTRFFAQNNYFGLSEDQVFFFTQGTMPAIGYDGKLLMSNLGSLALSPDGHGGTLLALRKSGALARMEKAGVEYISYFQVDNPLVPVLSPRFIGLHRLTNSQMSAVMLAKTNSQEKLGNFCVSNHRLQIIEYSDLPTELAEKRLPDGTLAYIAGSPAIHVIDRNFVEALTAGGKLQLPWHRADKKIPCIDAAGNPVAPEAPNGVKLESFIFDALPLAERTLVLECVRSEVFAPTKNATGVDSAESCREMLIARDIRRLRAAGVEVGAGAQVEIAPYLAVDDADVAELVKARKITAIPAGAKVVIE